MHDVMYWVKVYALDFAISLGALVFMVLLVLHWPSTGNDDDD